MKIIGIESSSLVASAALWEDGKLLAEYTVDHKKTHSQTLLPMLEEICRMTECGMKTVDAVAVSAGPGSFTGLRIGAATAKGDGQAAKPFRHRRGKIENAGRSRFRTHGGRCFEWSPSQSVPARTHTR